jgi:trk system potassium uptake protein TrkA
LLFKQNPVKLNLYRLSLNLFLVSKKEFVMKIIIIGDGKVGHSLAEYLSHEDNDVTIIDKNAEALKKSDESLDVMCIKGNGVSTSVLMEAGVKEADVLIAATSSDEMNMVCCMTAKKLGAQHTVARIRDPEYANELSMLRTEMDLDLVINPEQAAAREIARLLRFPSAADIELFVKGRVELAGIRVTEGMPIIGMRLKNIPARFSSDILIGAVQRGEKVFIPDGSFEIYLNDNIYIIGKPSSVFNFCKQIGKCTEKIRNVMVVGGGRIAYYLAKNLKHNDVKVKIIEINKERCRELSEHLSETLIIHSDGTDAAILNSENLSDMDAFISITGRDEDNMISALLAKQSGIKKVIAKITRFNYPDIIKNLGIDNVINPKVITANYILKYVRGLKNARGNPIETLYRIIDEKVETLEFTIRYPTEFLNIPLKDLKITKGVLVAAIARKNAIIIPHGHDVIKLGDSVIIITKHEGLYDLNEIIRV